MTKKVEIGNNAKVVLKWNVTPINYSKEKEEEIKSQFAKKYDIDSSNITVEPIMFKNGNNDKEDNVIDTVSNIQDSNFQKILIKKYLEENGCENYDLEKIYEYDDIVNTFVDYDAYEKHKKYSIKWIRWSNFMSYGSKNYFNFKNLNGLVLLTSEPSNQGGKTTFCLDLLRFLLFGKVTSREGDWTLSKCFNRYLKQETEVIVEGCIEIDGVEYVIKRTINRPSEKKRTSKSKVSQKISYYRLFNGEYVELDDEDVENENSVSNRETNRAIKDAIGRENDFDLMICVDSDNLKSLISLKDTERGRLISRWIGLLVLEDKDKAARNYFLKEVSPKLLSNKYNKSDVESEISSLTADINKYSSIIDDLEKKSNETIELIGKLNSEKDEMSSKRLPINDELCKIDVETLNERISKIIADGNEKKAKKEGNMSLINEYGSVEFDENLYNDVIEERRNAETSLATLRTEASYIKKEIDKLKNSEYCPTCGAKLKNVDNSELIKKSEDEFNNKVELGKKTAAKVNELNDKVCNLNKLRETFNNVSKLKVMNDKLDVDLERLRIEYTEAKKMISDIQTNIDSIKTNNEIDNRINIINENIKQNNNLYHSYMNEISKTKATIISMGNALDKSNGILKFINEEESVIRNWKLYLELIGKNGISKMVIRSVLPMINNELRRMLNDVCDFDIEIDIDDRNDVAFYIVHDNEKASLASGSGFEQTVASLALRSVLSKVSTFSKPSFVVFDEILGGVSKDNYDMIKLLFDKIKTDYQFILHITHNNLLFDWHEGGIITVKKEKNVSYIENM